MLTPEHVWWCPYCGKQSISAVRLDTCAECEQGKLLDLGWRVGYNHATYSYYSTKERAARDPRILKGER